MNNTNRVATEESLEEYFIEDWSLFETSNKTLLYYMDNYKEDLARKPNKKCLRSLRKCKRLDYKFKELESEMYKIVRSGNLPELKKLIKKICYTYLNIQNQATNVANKPIDIFIYEIINQEIDEDGNTPLHIATLFNRLEMVKFLIERKALLFATNKKGENLTSRFWFWDSFHSNVRNYIQSHLPEKDTNSGKKKPDRKNLTQKQWKEVVFQNKMKFEKNKFAKMDDKEKRNVLKKLYGKRDYHFMCNFRCFFCGERIKKECGHFSKEWFCSIGCFRKKTESL